MKHFCLAHRLIPLPHSMKLFKNLLYKLYSVFAKNSRASVRPEGVCTTLSVAWVGIWNFRNLLKLDSLIKMHLVCQFMSWYKTPVNQILVIFWFINHCVFLLPITHVFFSLGARTHNDKPTDRSLNRLRWRFTVRYGLADQLDFNVPTEFCFILEFRSSNPWSNNVCSRLPFFNFKHIQKEKVVS